MSIDMVGRLWVRPMTGRSTDEPHRVSTPLECLFDLCFVVAVAQVGAAYEHLMISGHVGQALLGYTSLFFAIWWAWMNFSWFASGYDTDDVPYRLAVFVQIVGALVIAAGVEAAVADSNFTTVTWGYFIIRVAGVAQWFRAASSDRAHRRTALRNAYGVALVQCGWLIRLYLVPPNWQLAVFAALVAAELFVPAFAQLAEGNLFHPEHIGERFGLFTLIVLGEAATAAVIAVKAGLAEKGHGGDILIIALSAAVILFIMWWLYFDHADHDRVADPKWSFLWGYAHYFIFTGVAALGAGVAISVEHLAAAGGQVSEVGAEAGAAAGSGTEGVAGIAGIAEPSGHLSDLLVSAAVTVPVAVFLGTVLFLRSRAVGNGAMRRVVPAVIALILATTVTHVAIPLTAGILVALLTTVLVLKRGASVATIDVDRPAAAG